MGIFKDFVAGFKTGADIVQSKDDREYKRFRNQLMKQKAEEANDPELKKLNRDVLRARANRLNRGPREMDPEQRRGLKLRNDAQEKLNSAPVPGADTGAADSYTPTAPLPGKRSALDTGDGADMAGGDQPADMQMASYEGDLPDEEPDDGFDYENMGDTQFAACGGVIEKPKRRALPVKHYADGGTVEDDVPDTVDTGSDDEGDSLDQVDAIAEDGYAPPVGYSPQAAHDAVRAGLNHSAKSAGLHDMSEGAVEVSGARRQAQALTYAQSKAAAPANEMAAVRRVIKEKYPNMNENTLTMASMAHVYEYRLKSGNPRAAAETAASMVQHYKIMSSRYKSIAQAAAEAGDVDEAVGALVKSYNNIPDGKNIKIEKTKDGNFSYKITDDASGKVTEENVATPEQILQFATKGAAKSFEDLIVYAGGERAAPKAAKEAGPAKLADREKAMEVIDKAMEPTTEGGKSPFEFDLKLAPSIKHVASQIVSDNNMPAKDAIEAVQSVLTVGGPEKFKVAKTENGGATLQVNGREIKLTKDAYQNLVVLRGQTQSLHEANTKVAAEKKAAADKNTAAAANAATAKTAAQNERWPGEGNVAKRQQEWLANHRAGTPQPKQALPIYD